MMSKNYIYVVLTKLKLEFANLKVDTTSRKGLQKMKRVEIAYGTCTVKMVTDNKQNIRLSYPTLGFKGIRTLYSAQAEM